MVWLLFQKLFLFVWNHWYKGHFLGLRKVLEPIALMVMFFAAFFSVQQRAMKSSWTVSYCEHPHTPAMEDGSQKMGSWSSGKSMGSNHSCWKENSTQRQSELGGAVWGKCMCDWVRYRVQKQSNKQNELWREQESWICSTYIFFPPTVDAQHHDSWHIETSNSNHLCVLIQLCIAIAI